jgi:hypothetical protein
MKLEIVEVTMNDTRSVPDRRTCAPASPGVLRRVVGLAARSLLYRAVLIPLGGRVGRVHQRLTRALDSARLAGWVVPVTLVVSVAAVVLLVAWTHQI